ncbi:MAG: PAS domain-containing protein [Promethearchaeia archaeon]
MRLCYAEIDGLDLLEHIREESDIPFILFMGKGCEEVAMKALNLSADRYLQKSYDVQTQYKLLADAIAQEVNHYRTKIEQRKAEQRYRLIAEDMPKGNVYVIDRNLRVVFTTGKVLEEIGLTSEFLVGKSVKECEKDAARRAEIYFQKALKGKSLTFETGHKGRYFLLNVVPLKEDNDEIEGLIVLSVVSLNARGWKRNS